MHCFCPKVRTHHCKVVLLDEQELLQEIQDSSLGQDVLDTVFRHLNLLETAYFGLRYVDCHSQTHWLDATKKVAKQLKGKDSFTLYFGVKFYAVDPCKLVEEITRYQFFLQLKQDVLQGRLPVNFDLACELGSYAVQSELGDYDPRKHSPGYVSEFRFLTHQTAELENKIAELHKSLQGQLPAVAELNYLDKAKWQEMYGVDLHPVIGEDSVEYFIGLSPTGVIVLRNKIRVANYYWPRISKIHMKGKYFMIRVCDKNNEENTYGFETPSPSACKHLHKCCVQHHSFFRLVHVSPSQPDVVDTRISNGKLDRFSGRSSTVRNQPSFERTPSRRYQRRVAPSEHNSNQKLDGSVSFAENKILDPKSTPYSTPTNPVYVSRGDSPRSTRSAPWGGWGTNGAPRTSVYSSHSPRSVRSAGPSLPLRLTRPKRSSSIDSQSSNESKSCRRHKHHNKRASDNESELSRCSSHGRRRHRHRSRRSSASDHDRHSSYSSASRSSKYQLVESEEQWKEVQRKQASGGSGIHLANIIMKPHPGYSNEEIEPESQSTCRHTRHRHRKHRSRSRSPSDGGKSRLPEELKKHLEFQLVDTDGMSQDQLREIPYTVVKTSAAKAVRVHLNGPKDKSRRSKSSIMKDGGVEDSPPPPYSESPSLSDLSNKTGTTSTSAPSIAASKHRGPNSIRRSGTSKSSYEHNDSMMYSSSGHLPIFHRNDDSSNITTRMNGKAGILPGPLVTGLPPQSYRKSNHSSSQVDIPLIIGRQYKERPWSQSEVRNANGQTWTPLPDEIVNQVSNHLYTTLESPRRTASMDLEHSNINQNILEHRTSNGSVLRCSMKAVPQSNLNLQSENEGNSQWSNEKKIGWQPVKNNSYDNLYSGATQNHWTPTNYGSVPQFPTVFSSSSTSWQPSPFSSSRISEKGPLVFSSQSNHRDLEPLVSIKETKEEHNDINNYKEENENGNDNYNKVNQYDEKIMNYRSNNDYNKTTHKDNAKSDVIINNAQDNKIEKKTEFFALEMSTEL